MCIYAPDFARQANKIVGRQACEHFASLLIDCSAAARDALAMLGDRREENAPTPRKETAPPAPSGPAPAAPAKAPRVQAAGSGQGPVIDLHLHSLPASACAADSIDEMLAAAKALGLSGVCLTDHNFIWTAEDAAALAARHGLLILRGTEITTVQGDILVFGYGRTVTGIPDAAGLCREVAAAGGLTIAAHPFRGFRTVGARELGLTLDKAKQRPLFKQVDAVEAANSKVTADENDLAAAVAAALGLPAVGGSDAHAVGDVGIFATRFDCQVGNEAELIAAVKAGAGRAVAFKSQGEVSR